MRNVIVTGGSRGLGLGIAQKLAASGFSVIAVARSETDARIDRNGIPLLPSKNAASPVTLELVNQLRDE